MISSACCAASSKMIVADDELLVAPHAALPIVQPNPISAMNELAATMILLIIVALLVCQSPRVKALYAPPTSLRSLLLWTSSGTKQSTALPAPWVNSSSRPCDPRRTHSRDFRSREHRSTPCF